MTQSKDRGVFLGVTVFAYSITVAFYRIIRKRKKEKEKKEEREGEERRGEKRREGKERERTKM